MAPDNNSAFFANFIAQHFTLNENGVKSLGTGFMVGDKTWIVNGKIDKRG